MRLFVALRPPAAIRDELIGVMEGVAAVRWQDDAQLHVTLRFLGDVGPRGAEDIADALSRIHAPVPEVRVAGVGRFDDTLWAGLAPHDGLAALHRKVDHACVRAGVPPERRAYLPHVTLARFARSARNDSDLEHWIHAHAGLGSPPFVLSRLILYESILGRGGAHYEPIAYWPLGTGIGIAG